MALSQKAWQFSSKIIQAIKAHPLNQELLQGTLAQDKFAYYIEQDSLYLQDFARCHAILASKAPMKYIRSFLRYADYTFTAEQEIVHEFFRKTFNFNKTGCLSPATLNYTSYLKAICTTEPVEIGIAAVLPCFWVYHELGLYIAKNYDPQTNAFSRWIETYASEEFSASVKEIISIFDEVASNTTDEIRDGMLDAFYKSTCFEWHFWNDAYYKRVFDQV